jgi:hypothetical protein
VMIQVNQIVFRHEAPVTVSGMASAALTAAKS